MNTYRYLFLHLLLLILSSAAFAGENDTVFRPSARIGVDFSGVPRNLIEPETRTGEVSVDYEWRKNWFAAIEAGGASIEVDQPTHDYQSSGYFFRIGVDFNILGQHGPDHLDLVLLSARYGYGTLDHYASRAIITDPYWGDYETAFPEETFNAHWLEVGGGVKTQIWRNFFLGWSLRTRLLVSQTSDPAMDPYFISGFGKNRDGNFSVMIHYSLYYRFGF